MELMGKMNHGRPKIIDDKARGADHWRSVMDNVIIEFLATLTIVFSTVLYGGGGTAEGGIGVFKDPCRFCLLFRCWIGSDGGVQGRS